MDNQIPATAQQIPTVRQIANGAFLTPERAAQLTEDELDHLHRLIAGRRASERQTELACLKASVWSLQQSAATAAAN